MPFDPALRRRFEPFQDEDQRTLLADPARRARWDEAFCHREGYEPPSVRITDHEVEGPIGPFGVRVYRPHEESSDRPVFVWVHGGGFVAGSIDMVEGDVLSRELCARGGVTVVSVDYHLAGSGASYPTLHREVVAAFSWARANHDGAPLALGGGSAGGNLALAAALELRDAGGLVPDRLVLVYPALHREHRIAPEVEAELATLPKHLGLNQKTLDWMFRMYAGDASDTTLLAPGECDLAGLPPCLVIVDEYDGLRSSGERFVADARAAGVDVELYLAEGMPHGHLNMTPRVPEVGESLDRLAKFLGS